MPREVGRDAVQHNQHLTGHDCSTNDTMPGSAEDLWPRPA